MGTHHTAVRAARAAAVVALLLTAQAPLASPASAQATAEPGRYGIKPIQPPAGPSAPASNTLTVRTSKSTGVVSPTPKVYLVFWGSQWSSDPKAAAPALQNFFSGLFGSADTWGTILDQYCEGVPAGTSICGSSGIHVQHPGSSILAGVWFDNATAAPLSASKAQIGAEAAAAAQHFGNTSQKPNLNAQYVIASAHGTHPDGFPATGFCAWHSSIKAAAGRLAYTNLPYIPDAGASACTTLRPAQVLDGYFSTETHEYAETVTDFWPSRGWNGGGGEIGDACTNLDARLTLTTGTFDVQGLWSNAANACVTHG